MAFRGLAGCFHESDGNKAVGIDRVSIDPVSNVNGFILSLLPALGTMGSKWGGAWATGSSTSYSDNTEAEMDEMWSYVGCKDNRRWWLSGNLRG